MPGRRGRGFRSVGAAPTIVAVVTAGAGGALVEAAVSANQAAADVIYPGGCTNWAYQGLNNNPPRWVSWGSNCWLGKKYLAHANFVTGVQRVLRSAGYHPGTADGVFGDQTETAVKKYQSNRGLNSDGVVGNYTWSALAVDTVWQYDYASCSYYNGFLASCYWPYDGTSRFWTWNRINEPPYGDYVYFDTLGPQ